MKKKQNMEYEDLASLVEEYYDQTEGQGEAFIQINSNKITLLVNSVHGYTIVYHAICNDDLFEAIDFHYGNSVKIANIADDYFDRWNAVLLALEPAKIFEEHTKDSDSDCWDPESDPDGY